MAKKKLEIAIPEVNIKNTLPKVLVGSLIVAAFVIGTLWQKVQTLEKAANTTTTTTGTATQPTSSINIDTIKGLWNKDLIKFGDANKKLLFVEIGDPSCPFCHAAGGENHDIAAALGPNFKLVADGGTYDAPVTEMRKLVDSGQASFAYVYFPGHGAGEVAMHALYCANEKGRFWQAHDLLMSSAGYNLMNNTRIKFNPTQVEISNGYRAYKDQDAVDMSNFLKDAVDSNFMSGCIKSKKYVDRLNSDTTIARTLGVSGTPGFFINAEPPYPGAFAWDQDNVDSKNQTIPNTSMKYVSNAALK